MNKFKRLLTLIMLCSFSWESALGLELKGDFIQGGLLFGRAAVNENIEYRGKLLQLDSSGRFIIGLDRDEAAEIVIVSRSAEGFESHSFDIKKRIYNIQRITGIEQKYVDPDPVQVTRSKREAALVWRARQAQRSQNDFMRGFIWPASGPITGVFGSQRVYNGKPRRPHYGVDIAGPVGTAVVAPASGKVALAEDDLYFSGGTIIIDHGHGLSSSFLHLSEISVSVDQAVSKGEVIGAIGATGRVTGPHLDWRLNWTGSGENQRLDPQLLMPEPEPLLAENP